MSDKIKCPECGFKTYSKRGARKICLNCRFVYDTGEVESFWTQELPKEGLLYMVITNRGERYLGRVFMSWGFRKEPVFRPIAVQRDLDDLRHFDPCYGFNVAFEDIKCWSREPIRFPEPPNEEQEE